ncbi:Fur family ferric uptake transcriptional regulator [Pedobacter sp. UYP30]|uniref:Fur family transcriptional regulator n=1 Tax=Pedobacter sp. UYP30 TaxID=1756400 RepID=UPI003397589C
MADLEDFGDLLERNHLKKTSTRLTVLGILKSKREAISQPDLEKILGKGVDRVTLYRTLSTFEEKGILHKVLDLNGTANYAFCSSSSHSHKHQDEHVHFNCTACLTVYCLDELKIPIVNLPIGYSSQSINLIVYGICNSCNEKATDYLKKKNN